MTDSLAPKPQFHCEVRKETSADQLWWLDVERLDEASAEPFAELMYLSQHSLVAPDSDNEFWTEMLVSCLMIRRYVPQSTGNL